jgi:hypothetical protein
MDAQEGFQLFELAVFPSTDAWVVFRLLLKSDQYVCAHLRQGMLILARP